MFEHCPVIQRANVCCHSASKEAVKNMTASCAIKNVTIYNPLTFYLNKQKPNAIFEHCQKMFARGSFKFKHCPVVQRTIVCCSHSASQEAVKNVALSNTGFFFSIFFFNLFDILVLVFLHWGSTSHQGAYHLGK